MIAITQPQKEWLIKNRSSYVISELAKSFNKEFGTDFSKHRIHNFCKTNKIKSGKDGRFAKGRVLNPSDAQFRKGDHCSPTTEFKPGQLPHNYKPIGSERTSEDGYVSIKVADPGTWKQKHRLVYEAANGPIPPKHKLVFRDGNKLNFYLANLVLVTNAEHLRLVQNQYQKQHEDIKDTVFVISKLQVALFSKSKGNQHV